MKATELMIGDWVYDKVLRSNTRVEALQPLTIKCDIHTHKHICDEFEPVKLTPEILEKNSFSDIDNNSINKEIGFWHWYRLDRIGALEEPLITQHLNSGMFSLIYENNEIHALRYVHELQHAIRLCGLEELAENFTV